MSLTLDPKTTAVVLIDLEHGIVSRDLEPYPRQQVVDRGARLAEAIRTSGGVAVYVHVLLNEIVRPPCDRPTSSSSTPRPEGSELVPEAGFQPATDVLIAKRQWGAFHATNLDQALRRRGVLTIVLAGVATNLGVESTARAAIEHGYGVVFASDAMSTFSAELQEFAINTMFPMIGLVRTTDEIVAALSSGN